jgi:hypothetical protein
MKVNIVLIRKIILNMMYISNMILTISLLFIIAVICFIKDISFLYVLSGFIIWFIFYEAIIRWRRKYYIYPISDQEYEKIKHKTLIHYTNKITDEEYNYYKETGYINLVGTTRATSNYVMPYRDKKVPHVWFHPGQEIEHEEPEISSYLFSHVSEYKPRRYKVLIRLKDLNKNQLFIRPDNQNILMRGNVQIKGVIQKEFQWYNQKIYFKKIVIPVLRNSMRIYFQSWHQLYGKIIDRLRSS